MSKLRWPLSTKKHGTLVSQELRKLIQEDVFPGFQTRSRDPKLLEDLIQPASLDTLTDGFCFGVPDDFTPEHGLTVMNSVRLRGKKFLKEIELPRSGGLLERGKTYLIPLKGKFSLPEGYRMFSNPKSTQGRNHNQVRMVADGISAMDVVHGPWQGQLYLLFKPKSWSNIMYEDLALNQLRFFYGSLRRASGQDLAKIWDQLVFTIKGQPVPPPNKHFLDEGVEMTVDLKGEDYDGVVGFVAKPSHQPFDQKGKHDWADFFDAIIAPETLRLPLDDANMRILTTRYNYRIPQGYCAYMTAFTLKTSNVRFHDAGFGDTGFEGTFTLEVENLGGSPYSIHHGATAGYLEFFVLREPSDKVYDPINGNNYKFQSGPRLGKQFPLPDAKYKGILHRINKLKEQILVVERAYLGLDHGNKDYFQGFIPASKRDLMAPIGAHGKFLMRGPVEALPDFKQPIPYIVLIDPSDKTVFAYQRALDGASLTEERLRGKWSVGLGGHVRDRDGITGLDALIKGQGRELSEEVNIPPDLKPEFVGYLNDDRDAVGSVHLAMVYVAYVSKHKVSPKSKEIRFGDFYPLDQIPNLVREKGDIIEGWTEILLDALSKGALKKYVK